MQKIEKMIRQMSPDLQIKINDFIHILIEERLKKPGIKRREERTGVKRIRDHSYTPSELHNEKNRFV